MGDGRKEACPVGCDWRDCSEHDCATSSREAKNLNDGICMIVTSNGFCDGWMEASRSRSIPVFRSRGGREEKDTHIETFGLYINTFIVLLSLPRVKTFSRSLPASCAYLTMGNVFSIPTFFVLFRETIEAALIISVLLSFCHQMFADDQIMLKRLTKQVRYRSPQGGWPFL